VRGAAVYLRNAVSEIAMHIWIAAAALTLVSLPAFAQASAAPPPVGCSGPETQQIDFWLGDWDGAWDATPGTPAGTAVNHITRTYDGCVTEEHFDGGSLKGHSVSVYFAPAKEWRQTWVDNQGSYIDLTGGPDGRGNFMLTTLPKPSGKANRMIFTDIKPDSFTWRWQANTDGKTWADSWVIRYTRKKVG
jgi:hypothetical protein